MRAPPTKAISSHIGTNVKEGAQQHRKRALVLARTGFAAGAATSIEPSSSLPSAQSGALVVGRGLRSPHPEEEGAALGESPRCGWPRSSPIVFYALIWYAHGCSILARARSAVNELA